MTKEDDIKVVRNYINEGKVRGKKYLYLPAMINNHDDNSFYIALDEINRLGNMNNISSKEDIINRLLDWYESKSEGL